MTPEQRLTVKTDWREPCADVGKGFLGGGNSECKGPEVEVSWAAYGPVAPCGSSRGGEEDRRGERRGVCRGLPGGNEFRSGRKCGETVQVGYMWGSGTS